MKAQLDWRRGGLKKKKKFFIGVLAQQERF